MNNSISDVSVLEKLTSLTELSLKNNYVSDISVLGELKNLQFLDITGTNIYEYDSVNFVKYLYTNY